MSTKPSAVLVPSLPEQTDDDRRILGIDLSTLDAILDALSPWPDACQAVMDLMMTPAEYREFWNGRHHPN